MSRTTSKWTWLAWSLAALALGLEAAALVLIFRLPPNLRREGFFGWPESLAFNAPIVVGFSVMGAVVGARHPRNPVGWLMLLTAASFAASALAGEYAALGIFGQGGRGVLTGAYLAAWLWNTLAPLGLAFGCSIFLVFPTGELPGRAWRVPAALFLAACSVTLIGVAFRPDAIYLDWRHDLVVQTPFPRPPGLPAIVRAVFFSEWWIVFMPLSIAVAASSTVVRFVRAQGEQRQQLKWVVCVVVLIGVGFLLLTPAGLWEQRFPYLWDVAYAISSFGLIALPVTIAVGVLRYRLYAIDLILNRALLYGALTIVLGAAFLLGTFVSQSAVEAATGQRSDLLPAANGVLVALAFQPVRRRAKTIVDRVLPAREERALLFGDIVGSTQQVTHLGDSAWRQTLTQYRSAVRRQLRRFGGVEVHAAGDGFFATFGDPLQAVECARALAPGLRDLGVATRFGLHWGLCEVRGEDVTGLSVWIAARVMAAAGPSEIVVSDAMRDALETSGSDVTLEDRGVRSLKGLPGEWHLHALPGN